MNNKNVYPFKGWWPKSYFIMTHVKDDPNIEIDKDALINAVSSSKRTKKSRFENDTSLTDLRPTVPSKWDSDYDGSPVIDKIIGIEVSQNIEMNTNNDVIINNRKEINTLEISHQEEPMDTASDIGDAELKIEVNVCPIVCSLPQEPQVHAKLDTEYAEFLKIVCVKKTDENNEMPFLKENENNSPTKSLSLNNESIQDESEDDTSSKSSDESILLHNTTKEPIDRLLCVKSVPSFDKKLKKKKKASSKKSKKLKKKESKKNNPKSSSSESSQESESESDSSSGDSESDTSDSISTIERKKKKKILKDKKKKKSKTKKKYKGDKSKTKKPVDQKDIINLLQKALSAEFKQRPNENEDLKQKKKKQKHEKKIDGLKNTLLCEDSAVNEVLKYLKKDKEKKKKLKKSSKRKFDSDDSNNDMSSKKARFDGSLELEDSCEKKKKSKKKKLFEKKCVDLDESVLKKKSKKKSKTSDSSETEDSKGSKHKKKKNEKDSDYFFGPRPNEWNKINKSSMRGVVHHSAKNMNVNLASSSRDISRCNNEKLKNTKSLPLKHEHLCFLQDDKKNVCIDVSSIKQDKTENQLNVTKENIKTIKDYVLDTARDKTKKINFNNSASEFGEENECVFENNKNSQKDDLFVNNVVEHEVDVLQTPLSTNKNNEQQDLIGDQTNVLKLRQNKSPIPNDNDEPPVIILMPPAVPIDKTMSYRDKVKMNLKNLLSSCQNTPVGFVCSSPLGVIKSNDFKIGKIEENIELHKEETRGDESIILDDKSNMSTTCQDTQVGFVTSLPLGSTKPSNFELGKIAENFEQNNEEFKKDDKLKILNYESIKSPFSHMKNYDIIDPILPKIDLDMDNQVINHSFNWEDSEDSNSHQSSVKSVDISENLSNAEENKKIKSSLLENDLSNIRNKQNKHKTLSDDGYFKELGHSFESSETSFNSLDLETRREFQRNLFVENSVKEEETTNPSNLTFSHSTVYKSNNESIVVAPLEKKHFDSSSQNFSNDLDVFKNDNELITQWASDWSKLVDKSVMKINDSGVYRSDDSEIIQIKKKSRWDKQPKNDEVNEQHSLSGGQTELKANVSNYATDVLENSNLSLNINNEFLNEQNQECKKSPISCMNDNVEYDYCSENWSNDYESYNQYSCTPQYSEMKALGDSYLSPVDYSIYENYNPNYDYQDEDYNKWKTPDTSYELTHTTNITTTDETLASVQVSCKLIISSWLFIY